MPHSAKDSPLCAECSLDVYSPSPPLTGGGIVFTWAPSTCPPH
jgi:hypothetical protein